MIRAVIDTNILVSGLLSASGNEALVILAINQGLVRPALTEAILAEYADVLAQPKFSFPLDQIAALMGMLRRAGELFEPPASEPISPDPADGKFLAGAQAADADFLVTGNKRHFPLGAYGRTRIVSSGELLEVITREI